MTKKLIISFLLLSVGALAQNVDSLQSELDQSQGLERTKILHQLIYATWLNSPDEALSYANEAIDLSREGDSRSLYSKSLRLLAGVYSYKNDYKLALKHVYESLGIALIDQDSANISACYNNIGHMNINLGNYPDALEYLLRSKRIKEAYGMERNLPLTFNNIGRVYYEMQDYHKAREYFNKALSQADKFKDTNQIIYSLNNLSYAYLKEDNNIQAYKKLQESIRLCKGFNNKNWESTALRGMGITFLQDKQYDSAEFCFVKSKKLSGTIKDKIGIAEVYYFEAVLNWEKRNIQEALSFLEKSQSTAEEIGARKQIINNLELYMKIYQMQEQNNDFYRYQKKYIAFKDSILYQSTLRNVALIPIKLKHEQTTLNLLKKQAQLEKSRTINRNYVIVIITILALVIILAILYFKYRSANKGLKLVNFEIAAQKEEIETQNEELTQQSQELSAQREQIGGANQLISEKNAKLEQYAQMLERKVDHRTGQIAVLNKDLLSQNLRLEQFNYVTVHNLRSPITHLMGLMSILPEDFTKSESEVRDILGKMKYSAEQLDEIVRDLNQILSIRTGAAERIRKLSIIDELNVVVESLQNDLDSVDGKIILPTGDFYINAVQSSIRSIFHNLIQNSIKFHSKERPLVITVEVIEDENEQITAILEDNGIGIDMQYAGTKIFGLYQRFNSDYQGKGLGLYITKSHIHNMNGSISVDSELGRYTRFTINFSNA